MVSIRMVSLFVVSDGTCMCSSRKASSWFLSGWYRCLQCQTEHVCVLLERLHHGFYQDGIVVCSVRRNMYVFFQKGFIMVSIRMVSLFVVSDGTCMCSSRKASSWFLSGWYRCLQCQTEHVCVLLERLHHGFYQDGIVVCSVRRNMYVLFQKGFIMVSVRIVSLFVVSDGTCMCSSRKASSWFLSGWYRCLQCQTEHVCVLLERLHHGFYQDGIVVCSVRRNMYVLFQKGFIMVSIRMVSLFVMSDGTCMCSSRKASSWFLSGLYRCLQCQTEHVCVLLERLHHGFYQDGIVVCNVRRNMYVFFQKGFIMVSIRMVSLFVVSDGTCMCSSRKASSWFLSGWYRCLQCQTEHVCVLLERLHHGFYQDGIVVCSVRRNMYVFFQKGFIMVSIRMVSLFVMSDGTCMCSSRKASSWFLSGWYRCMQCQTEHVCALLERLHHGFCQDCIVVCSVRRNMYVFFQKGFIMVSIRMVSLFVVSDGTCMCSSRRASSWFLSGWYRCLQCQTEHVCVLLERLHHGFYQDGIVVCNVRRNMYVMFQKGFIMVSIWMVSLYVVSDETCQLMHWINSRKTFILKIGE